MIMPLWPGQTPCPNLKEAPDTVGWNRWRHGAPWICPRTPCYRYLLTSSGINLLPGFYCDDRDQFHITLKCNNCIWSLSLCRCPTWATLPACRAQDPRPPDTWGPQSVATAMGRVLRQSWSPHKHLWRTTPKMKMQRRMSLWSVWVQALCIHTQKFPLSEHRVYKLDCQPSKSIRVWFLIEGGMREPVNSMLGLTQNRKWLILLRVKTG